MILKQSEYDYCSCNVASFLTNVVLKPFDRFLSAQYHIKSVRSQQTQPEFTHMEY